MAYDPRVSTNPEAKEHTVKTVGLVAIVAVVVLVIAGLLYVNRDNKTVSSVTHSVTEKAKGAASSAKDAAAEVPQAAKDATTKGDQPTTRPNADGSTDQLDQKPKK